MKGSDLNAQYTTRHTVCIPQYHRSSSSVSKPFSHFLSISLYPVKGTTWASKTQVASPLHHTTTREALVPNVRWWIVLGEQLVQSNGNKPWRVERWKDHVPTQLRGQHGHIRPYRSPQQHWTLYCSELQDQLHTTTHQRAKHTSKEE